MASPACIEAETGARNQVAEVWPRLSATAQQRCLRLGDRRESFLIMSACVEREAAQQR